MDETTAHGRTRASRRIVEYDRPSHRLWILGQRCHHGATGMLVAAIACLGLATSKPSAGARSLLALAAAGALMAHDWKDHAVWFERGRGREL